MLLLSRNFQTQRIRKIQKIVNGSHKNKSVAFLLHFREEFNQRSGVDHETRTVLTETVGTRTRMSVTHEVASSAAVLDRLNLPVTERLNLLTNVAHGSAKVANSVLVESLTGINTPTASKMIDDLTLLRKSVV